jgi:hypothetical protein
MPSYAITAPDGKSYKIEAPEGTSKEDALSYFQQNWKPPEPTITPRKTPERWADVATQAVSNIPKSAANLVSGVAQTVAHPIDTAQNVLNIANAGMQKVLPESVNEFMHKVAPETAKNPAMGEAVADFYKDRYGSTEGFKRAIAEDPLGVASDVSTLATGGGALAAKVPGMAKVAQVATRAGEVANPVGMVAGAIGKGAGFAGNRAADVLGMTTGVGGEAIRQAYGAGRAGGEKAQAFAKNLRGDADIGEIVSEAQGALSGMRKARGEAYKQGMAGVSADKTVLSFEPIINATIEALDVGSFKGKSINRSALDTQKKITDVIEEWSTSSPKDYHTAEGFDALKRTIGDIRDSTEPRSPSRVVADRVYNSIKSEIVKQAPDYANVMKDYEEASRLTKEIERALSLGEKAAADTAIRKLQSLTRNNVNTNYGNRLKLAQELEQAGAPDLMTKLSGQALSSPTPRGLQGVTSGGTAALGLYAHNPMAIPILATQSPRLVGETAFAAGRIGRRGGQAGSELGDIIDASQIDPKLLANYLYQAQQPKEIQ